MARRSDDHHPQAKIIPRPSTYPLSRWRQPARGNKSEMDWGVIFCPYCDARLERLSHLLLHLAASQRQRGHGLDRRQVGQAALGVGSDRSVRIGDGPRWPAELPSQEGEDAPIGPSELRTLAFVEEAGSLDDLRRLDDRLREQGETVVADQLARCALDGSLGEPAGDGLYHLWKGWQLPGAEQISVVAADAAAGRLVVIEAARSRTAAQRRDTAGRTAARRALHHADLILARRSAYYPFFERLARALGRLHGAEELQAFEVNWDDRPGTRVWLPWRDPK
jgi:hypothetical protein